MVGELEKGAHVLSEIGNFICLKHFFRSTADEMFMFFSSSFISLRVQRVLSSHLIYWVPHKLPPIYTVIAYICIGMVA